MFFTLILNQHLTHVFKLEFVVLGGFQKFFSLNDQ